MVLVHGQELEDHYPKKKINEYIEFKIVDKQNQEDWERLLDTKIKANNVKLTYARYRILAPAVDAIQFAAACRIKERG